MNGFKETRLPYLEVLKVGTMSEISGRYNVSLQQTSIEVGKDDVFWMGDKSLLGTPTFLLRQLTQWFRDRVSASQLEQWFGDGVECELLSPRGGGWQKGKVRICFEFIPDQPEIMPSDAAVLGEGDPLTDDYV